MQVGRILDDGRVEPGPVCLDPCDLGLGQVVEYFESYYRDSTDANELGVAVRPLSRSEVQSDIGIFARRITPADAPDPPTLIRR